MSLEWTLDGGLGILHLQKVPCALSWLFFFFLSSLPSFLSSSLPPSLPSFLPSSLPPFLPFFSFLLSSFPLFLYPVTTF